MKAGSTISPYELTGLSKRIKQIRNNALISEDNILLEDVLLDSLYNSACFVIGTESSENRFKQLSSGYWNIYILDIQLLIYESGIY